jgi:hypothetical protein
MNDSREQAQTESEKFMQQILETNSPDALEELMRAQRAKEIERIEKEGFRNPWSANAEGSDVAKAESQEDLLAAAKEAGIERDLYNSDHHPSFDRGGPAPRSAGAGEGDSRSEVASGTRQDHGRGWPEVVLRMT